MLVKICGLKYEDNIREIATFGPDMIGFIFYPESKRYVGGGLNRAGLSGLPPGIKKTGVFVNETQKFIVQARIRYKLDFIQLHGNEEPDYCDYLKKKGLRIIKAFQISGDFIFEKLREYEPACDYFLFDTPTSGYGGSGMAFDWTMIKNYRLETPFLLSGGLGPDSIEAALNLKHPKLAGFDLNSKLETEPGRKSPELTKKLIEKIRKHYGFKTN